MEGARVRVLVVDDHPLLRGGLKSMLGQEPSIELIGEAENGDRAMQICRRSMPDVVVMDVNIEGRVDVVTTERIKTEWPNIKVVAFSMHTEVQVIRRMLKAGASGYLTKSASHHDLIEAIHAVMRGEMYYDPSVMGIVTNTLTHGVEDSNADGLLSQREREVLHFVAKALTNQEMSDIMGISLRTVETHKRNLIKKLHVKNVVGLARYAIDNGFLNER